VARNAGIRLAAAATAAMSAATPASVTGSFGRTALYGHGIARHIQRTSEGVLRVEHESLYPALARLEKSRYITHGR